MNIGQMIFERPGGPDVGILLIDGRVETKKVGRSFPADLRLVCCSAKLALSIATYADAWYSSCTSHAKKEPWLGQG
jgi:hypothetical protein